MALLLVPLIPLPLLLVYLFAQLAQFRQRKAKGDGAHPKKTTAKRKSTAVTASVPEEEASTVAGSGGAPAPTPGAVQVGGVLPEIAHVPCCAAAFLFPYRGVVS